MARKWDLRLGKKLSLSLKVSVRIKFVSIIESVVTPVKLFIFSQNFSMDPIIKASHS